MYFILINKTKLTNSSFFLNPVNTTTVPTMACVYIGLLILGNESFFSANCRSAVGPNILQHVKLKQPKSDFFNCFNISGST